MNLIAVSKLEDIIGQRCKTRDIDDYPETDFSDPMNDRCPTCEAWIWRQIKQLK